MSATINIEKPIITFADNICTQIIDISILNQLLQQYKEQNPQHEPYIICNTDTANAIPKNEPIYTDKYSQQRLQYYTYQKTKILIDNNKAFGEIEIR